MKCFSKLISLALALGFAGVCLVRSASAIEINSGALNQKIETLEKRETILPQADLNVLLDDIFDTSLSEQNEGSEYIFSRILQSAIEHPNSPAIQQLSLALKRRYVRTLWVVASMSRQPWLIALRDAALKQYDENSFTRCEKILRGEKGRSASETAYDANMFQICDLNEGLRNVLARKYGEDLAVVLSADPIPGTEVKHKTYKIRAAYFLSEGILAIDFSQTIFSNFLSFIHESIHATDVAAADARKDFVRLIPQTLPVLRKYSPPLAARILERVSASPEKEVNENTIAEIRALLSKSTEDTDAALPKIPREEIEILKAFFKAQIELSVGQEIRAHFRELLMYREFTSPDFLRVILPRKMHVESLQRIIGEESSIPRKIDLIVALHSQEDVFHDLEPTPYLALLLAVRDSAMSDVKKTHTAEIKKLESEMPRSVLPVRLSGREDLATFIPPIVEAFRIIGDQSIRSFTAKIESEVDEIATYLRGKSAEIALVSTGGYTVDELPLDDVTFKSIDTFKHNYPRLFNSSIREWRLVKKLVPEIQALVIRTFELEQESTEIFTNLSANRDLIDPAKIRNQIEKTRGSLGEIARETRVLLETEYDSIERRDRDDLELVLNYLTEYLFSFKIDSGLTFNHLQAILSGQKQILENVRSIGEKDIDSRLSWNKNTKLKGSFLGAAFVSSQGQILVPTRGKSTPDLAPHGTARSYSVIKYRVVVDSSRDVTRGSLVFDTASRGYAVSGFIDCYGVGIVFANNMQIYITLFQKTSDWVTIETNLNSGHAVAKIRVGGIVNPGEPIREFHEMQLGRILPPGCGFARISL